MTGGKGVNVILEMLANVNLAKDLKLLAVGGRVVVRSYICNEECMLQSILPVGDRKQG